jgi:hypothetical protein
MIRLFSATNQHTHTIVRAAIAASLALPLGCSGDGGGPSSTSRVSTDEQQGTEQGADTLKNLDTAPRGPTYEESDTDADRVAVDADTLRITVRNASDRVQYVGNLGFWVRSNLAQVRNADLGDPEPPANLALYTNQPSCEQILSGEWYCGGHGDSVGSVLALAPGAEFTHEWKAEVWERSQLEEPSDCSCMERVKAPAGAYLAHLDIGTQLDCFDSACACDPGQGSCTFPGTLPSDTELESPVAWPEQTEVSFVIE